MDPKVRVAWPWGSLLPQLDDVGALAKTSDNPRPLQSPEKLS
jgi:hypothetical protein